MGLERWLPPRAFVLGVFLSALSSPFLPSVLLCSLILSFISRISLSFFLCPLVSVVRFFSSLYVYLCSCLLLLLMSWGWVSFAWVVMHVAVSVSFLLRRLASKKAREVPPCACSACFFFSLSRPLASCPHVCCCRACFCVDARARVATANLRLMLTVLLRRSPGDSSPSARLLPALCSYSPLLCPHG